MVHAAATWIGLFVIGFLAMQGANAALLALGAALCVLVSMYALGIERASLGSMLTALRGALGRAPAVLRGVVSTMRAAAAADVTLRPALVQVRTQAADDFSIGALAWAVSAAPGSVAVDASGDSVLVHVLEENDESAAKLSAIEARVVSPTQRGRG
jgi:multisubunit Na+/H+ antiporter MnhE subunit